MSHQENMKIYCINNLCSPRANIQENTQKSKNIFFFHEELKEKTRKTAKIAKKFHIKTNQTLI